jgi:hypothetical protein
MIFAERLPERSDRLFRYHSPVRAASSTFKDVEQGARTKARTRFSGNRL